MEFFIIYLLMILENIQGFMIAISVATGVISVIGMIYCLCEEENFPFWLKSSITAGVLCAFIACLIPSKKEMAVIAAAGVTYNVVTSDKAREIGGKSVEILIKKMDEILAEPEPQKK